MDDTLTLIGVACLLYVAVEYIMRPEPYPIHMPEPKCVIEIHHYIHDESEKKGD